MFRLARVLPGAEIAGRVVRRALLGRWSLLTALPWALFAVRRNEHPLIDERVVAAVRLGQDGLDVGAGGVVDVGRAHRLARVAQLVRAGGLIVIRPPSVQEADPGHRLDLHDRGMEARAEPGTPSR